MEDYLKINKELWNNKTPIHLKSKMYDLQAFKDGKSSLCKIELDLLTEIKGKKLLHMQCHFGQDTLSLERLGAVVTGADLSDVAIEEARKLTAELGLNAKYVCANVLELDQHLEGEFDVVFASFGVVGWHPELENWARQINHFLKPGGQFIFAEFHPAVWVYDDDFTEVMYSYFNKQTIIEEEEGTYADRSADIKLTSYCWNHGLSEVTNALMSQGLVITHFDEYDYSPHDSFRHTVPCEGGFHIKGFEGKLPMVYSLVVTKPE